MDERRVAGADPDPVHSTAHPDAAVVAAVAVGGVLGAASRYEAGLWWPTRLGAFPWTTFGINVLGSALIGVLMVLASEVFTDRRLLRPLLGTGVLGGFTTFSTYAVDARRLIVSHHAVPALAYLLATPAAALVSVGLAAQLTRVVLRPAGR